MKIRVRKEKDMSAESNYCFTAVMAGDKNALKQDMLFLSASEIQARLDNEKPRAGDSYLEEFAKEFIREEIRQKYHVLISTDEIEFVRTKWTFPNEIVVYAYIFNKEYKDMLKEKM